MRVEISSESILIAGRYNKFTWELSQSPWLIDGIWKVASSMQEEICPNMLELVKGSHYSFHSGGREDIDVRMLGKGRPFVIELHNPWRGISAIKDIEPFKQSIKSELIKIVDLRFVSALYFDEILKGEKLKSKLYTAIVWVKDIITPEIIWSKIDEFKETEIDQKTPLRVLHWWSLMTWKKLIHKLKGEYINPHFFILHVLASAGTYIKEFVHSDLGWTNPSIGSLLNTKADIL